MKNILFIAAFIAATAAAGQTPGATPENPAIEYGITASIIMGTFLLLKNLIEKMSVAIDNNTEALTDIKIVMGKIETKVDSLEDEIKTIKNNNRIQ